MSDGMHSRFWTFCAASNILLFFATIIVIFVNKDLSTEIGMSLTHRSVKKYSSAVHIWRDYYNTISSVAETPDYHSFLQVGLDAVGCSRNSTLSMCTCLVEAHAAGVTDCKAVAQNKMSRCFMMLRPVTQVDELDRKLNPYALLDTVNLWGMLGSLLIWMRMAISKEDESMPFTVQMMFGIFAVVIHCSVLEPRWESYVTFSVLVLTMSFISYLHRMDKDWWISLFHVQYMFTVPSLIVLEKLLTQRRDFSYIVFAFILSIAFVFVAFAKTFIEQLKQDSSELKSVENSMRLALFSMFVVICFSSYPASGFQYFESVGITWALTCFYLGLGLFGTYNIKRIYFMEMFFRLVISINMLVELGLARH